VIQFPETAINEWKIVADAANIEGELRKRIARDTQVEVKKEKLWIDHDAKVMFQQELDEGETPDLQMGTLATYNASPNAGPSDLIDGVFKDNGLCIFTGPAGGGKTTSSLQMLYSLMTGKDWLGQRVTKIQGSVGILSYDMDDSLVYDWMSGFPAIDPNKVGVVNAYKRGNPMNVPEMRRQIVAAWKAMDVEIVLLDSFSASFFGLNQNDTTEVQAHYRDIIKFALTEVGARGLIVIAHSTPGSPEKIRGASTHHGVADSILAQYPVNGNNTDPRTVRMVKYRSHRDTTGMMTTQMNPVIISQPDDVTHLVEVDPGAMTMVGMPLSGGAAAAVFSELPPEHEAPDTDSDSGHEDEDL
jgi:hypothetical protein